jgi:uncharacterized protein
MRTLMVIFLTLTFVAGISPCLAQPEVPTLQQRVTDFTNSLDFTQWRSLETRIQQFEDTTSIQIAVLLLNSLEGESIQEYAMRVFEKNQIGQKKKNNGVLILVAKGDRQVRIDVGYGLEGVLTDAAASQIISREIKPSFKEGDFYGGLTAGVKAIIALTAGEYEVEEKGGIAPVVSMVLALLFFGFLGAFVMPLLAGKRRFDIRSGTWMYNSGWGWRSGGLGGGGFGGGSFGGGGWSGGGGMAGGGGATGSW